MERCVVLLIIFVSNVCCHPVQSDGRPRCPYGAVIYEGKCETLFTRGPCDDGHWLVISNEGTPACQSRDCPADAGSDEIIEITSALLNNTCVVVGAQEPCPTGMHVILLMNGQADCDCQNGFVFWQGTNITTEGSCHLPYERGPCAEGQVLYIPPAQENATGLAECRETRCGDNEVEVEILSNGEVRLTETDAGQCVTLNGRNTPCTQIAPDHTLKVDRETMALKCGTNYVAYGIARSNKFGCKYGTKHNANGQCRDARLHLVAG